MNDARNVQLDITQKREAEILKVLKDNRDKQLKIEDESYKTQTVVFEKSLADKKITQQQYEMLVLSADSAHAEARLKINKQYQSDATSLELSSGSLKAEANKRSERCCLVCGSRGGEG